VIGSSAQMAVVSAARRVAVVDDHMLVGLAVGSVVESHPTLSYAGHARSVAELIRTSTRADLVLLDLKLGDGSQPEDNVAALRAFGAHVLILTAGDNPYLLRRVLQTEALGVIRKSAPPAVILGAIEAAARGETVHSGEWAIDELTMPLVAGPPLTDREREVMAMFASGMAAKSVARRLGISQNTVNDHLRRVRAIYRQIGRAADTKVQLYQRAQEDGYLPSPGA